MKSPLLAVFTALAVCLATLGLVIPQRACADSWAPPSTAITLSASGQYRFTVEPSPINSALDYISDEVRAERDGRTVERVAPIGVLERKNQAGEWEPVWMGPLVNQVSPVSAVVADDGQHVVTFDNWHSVGRGEHVVVIYGPEGKLVRSMELSDLVPEHFIEGLSHTVSSTRWKDEAAIVSGEDVLVIDVLVPSSEPPAKTVTFRIALADGRVTLPAGPDWEAALCAADTVKKQRDEKEQEYLAYLREPLLAPAGCDAGDWHGYLYEAHLRLAPDYLNDPSTSTTVLFPPDNPRHQESVGWLRDRLIDEWEYPRSESFASPCAPEALVAAIASIISDVKPGSLPNATFYISSPKTQFTKISRLVEPSGAKLVWLRPDVPIPQRLERVPGSQEKKAADAERVRRIEAEMQEMMREIEGLTN